jgi:hypothetical protein
MGYVWSEVVFVNPAEFCYVCCKFDLRLTIGSVVG